MLKKILIISFLLLCAAPGFSDEEVESEEVSGLVRVVRSSPETEIFFVDRKDSVIVPSFHPDHNRAVRMSMDSIKNKKPISLSVNPVSKRLISAGGKKASSQSVSEALEDSGSETTKPASKKPASGGFKEIPGDTAQ